MYNRQKGIAIPVLGEKSGTKYLDKIINGTRRFRDGLLIISSIKLNLVWNEPGHRRKRTIEANWIELSGNTESISRHAALAVRHNYIRLKAQHAPDSATYVVVGYTRMYSDGYRRSANSSWSMEDPAIYNAFPCGQPGWRTCARYTYAYTGIYMHVSAYVYFRMASRT